jgi:hypothetical protein
MHLDSAPATTRRCAETPRRRGDRRKPTRQAERSRPNTATARRSRLDDAIVSQWLLEQVPADHRHAALNASDPRHHVSA